MTGFEHTNFINASKADPLQNPKDKIIAYDLGTGGIKASLFDVEGCSYANTFQPYDTFFTGSDFHEQNPDDWFYGIVNTTKQLLAKTGADPKNVAALSISGHSLSVVPVDKDKRLLRSLVPIWSDTRAVRQAERFFKKVSYEDWYMHTGNGFPAECYSIFKTMWYKENEPEMYSHIYKVLGSKDYCNLRLTGTCFTDHSYASGSGVYDLKGHGYKDTFIKASGIHSDYLPEIRSSHEILGTLTGEAAALLGLSPSVKVVCGGVDNSCMALGAKGTSPGRIYTSLGSSSWIAVVDREPILDFQYKPFVFAHCMEGFYTSATSIFSAGNSFRWVRDNICSELVEKERNGLKDAYTAMNEMILESPVGANKLIFNPSMAGGSMIEECKNITSGYVGLTLGHTKSDLIRSAMEGITFNLKYALNILTLYKPGIKEMLLVGGGSKSEVWRQMFADIFDMDIVKTNIDQDAASLGAAALAAFGLGYWKDYAYLDILHQTESVKSPISENTLSYNKLYPVHREIAHYMSLAGSKLHHLEL